MNVPADQLLTAIEQGHLESTLVSDGEQSAIGLFADGEMLAAVGCLRIDRPAAKLTHDGNSVDVYPSPGLPDGFTIACASHEEAIIIEEALEDCFETAYLKLVDSEGE